MNVTISKCDDPNTAAVECDDFFVGKLRKATNGPGYFLSLDGILWENAPGARYRADAGSFPETYCPTVATAKHKTTEALKANGWESGKRPPKWK